MAYILGHAVLSHWSESGYSSPQEEFSQFYMVKIVFYRYVVCYAIDLKHPAYRNTMTNCNSQPAFYESIKQGQA